MIEPEACFHPEEEEKRDDQASKVKASIQLGKSEALDIQCHKVCSHNWAIHD